MTKTAKVTDDLRQRVRSGEWSSAQALPSRAQLSTEYGVAPGTLSLVLRNLEDEGLVRILPRKGVLVTDLSSAPTPAPAPSPALGSSPAMTIGLRGSYVRSGMPRAKGYQGNLLGQLLEAAGEKEVPLLILQQNENHEPFTKARCQAMGIGGLIYLGSQVEEEALRLRLEGFPVIAANRPVGNSPLNYVDCDHIGTLNDAVHRFACLGHRRIAVVMSPTQIPGTHSRLRPYFMEALWANGLNYDARPYWITPKHEPELEEERQLQALFSQPDAPTAVFCWGTSVSDWVYQVLQKIGKRVPEDVSILSASTLHLTPMAFSGYLYDFHHFGQRLLENLFATIENPFHFAQEAIPFEFVEGGSVAAPS